MLHFCDYWLFEYCNGWLDLGIVSGCAPERDCVQSHPKRDSLYTEHIWV